MDDYAQTPAEIKAGMLQLKKRERSLNLAIIVSMTLGLISLVAILTQQEMIYSFFGVNEYVQQLHVPVSADEYLTTFGEQRDYFWNFLSWISWIIIKLLSAFFGAFIVLSILKKIKYFQVKFQSLIMRFVSWLIAFIVIWGGVTYLQYADDDDPQAQYAQLVHYDRNIQQSAIAQHLRETNTTGTVADYLLAQTALLNQDKIVAKVYLERLIQAEKQQPSFEQYGFLPQQLWSMQYQVYGEARTPFAQKMLAQAHQAQTISVWLERILIVLVVLLSLMILICWMMRKAIKSRIKRINEIIS